MSDIEDDGISALTVTLVKMDSLNAGPHSLGIVYNRMRYRWTLIEALMGGTILMKARGRLFLPQHPAESDQEYSKRLRRAVLRNYYKRTVMTLVGKVFSKGVIFSDNAPEDVQQWSENIDMAGSCINEFANKVFEDALAMGISYILVDFPRTADVGIQTLEQERNAGVRPYAIHVKARNLISFSSEMINGIQTLTEIRIHEERIAEKEDGGQACVNRLRIVRRDSYEVQEQVDSEWQTVESGPMTLGFIPLITVYTQKVGFMECEPPLEDLAWMNLEHWQIRSDQRTSLMYASFPILAASGWSKESDGELAFGPGKGLATADPAGRFYYIESGGAHLTAGREELKDLEEQMRLFGLQFEQGGSSKAQTATEKIIDTAEGVAPLHTWTENLESALETMFVYMYKWLGRNENLIEDILEVDPDMGLSMKDSHDVDTLVKLRSQGDITRRSLLDELKLKTVLSEDFDVQAELDAIEAEAPTSMGPFIPSQDPNAPDQQAQGNDTVSGGDGNQQ